MFNMRCLASASTPVARCPAAHLLATQAQAAPLRIAQTPGCARDLEEPWYIGFQMNERYLHWGESGQARFIKLHCAKELGWSQEKVEQELDKLMALLPGLELRFERMKADLVIKMLTQQHTVAACLVALRAALPFADIAAIATTLPSLLTTRTPEQLTASVQSIRDALPDVPEAAVDGMIEAEPRILGCDIPLLLAEIERLLPGQNPKKLLIENPSSYMDMASHGLRPSLEDEPGLQSLPSLSEGLSVLGDTS